MPDELQLNAVRALRQSVSLPGTSALFRAGAGGIVAGAVGTVAMDLLWYRRGRKAGSRTRFWDWETAAQTRGYDHASAPAKTAQRLAGMVGVELPPSSARAATDVMHWAMGTSWGAAYGVSRGTWPSDPPAFPRAALLAGAFPVAVFTFSYVTLGALGVYEPIWKYPARVVLDDFTAHLLYGAVTAATCEVVGHLSR